MDDEKDKPGICPEEIEPYLERWCSVYPDAKYAWETYSKWANLMHTEWLKARSQISALQSSIEAKEQVAFIEGWRSHEAVEAHETIDAAFADFKSSQIKGDPQND